MKVILINSVNSKDKSTGRIMLDIQEYFDNQNDKTLFLFGRGKANGHNQKRIENKFGFLLHTFLSRLFGLQGYFSPFSTSKAKRIIKKFKPDVVFVGNLHGYYINYCGLLSFLKKSKIPTCLFLFDDYWFMGKCAFSNDCFGFEHGCGNCPRVRDYPKSFFLDRSKKIVKDKVKLFSNYNELLFCGFPATVDKVQKSFIYKSSNARVVKYGWGIKTDGPFRIFDKKRVREELGLPCDKRIVLAVAPLSNERKGIKKYFFALANSLNKYQEFFFVHIGNDDSTVSVPKNVTSLPYLSNQEILGKYFSCADYFTMLSESEGYPTVCIYSLLCGTPIIAFDSVDLGKDDCGECIKYFPFANIDAIASFLLISSTAKSVSTQEKCRKKALDSFGVEKSVERLLNEMGVKYEKQ